MPTSGPSPGDDFVGFGIRPAHDDQPQTFVMPSLGEKGTLSAFSFALDCVQAIRKDAGRLEGAARVVRFAAARTVLTSAVTVLVTEIFDTAVAEMLTTVGDTTAKSAARALMDAKATTSASSRDRHRHTAEEIMRQAYDQYLEAYEKRTKKLGYRLMSRTPDMELNMRAAQMALTIALINSELGDVETTETWCKNATLAGRRYLELHTREELIQATFHAKQARKPMHPYDWSDPRPAHARKSGDAALRVIELKLETQRLEQTCTDLIQGARQRRAGPSPGDPSAG